MAHEASLGDIEVRLVRRFALSIRVKRTPCNVLPAGVRTSDNIEMVQNSPEKI
jgi:hypothetical protein